MRINHNLPSMVGQASLFKVNREMSKSLQKLSTGMRINTAADDAAGLGVSENLRTQIRGSNQAFRNAQDVTSLLNIAEGALNEQSDILQRMRELVIQAKNDTYSQVERNYMGEEFEALYNELDRISFTTNYNGIQLFADQNTANSSSDSPKSSGNDETIWDGGAPGPLGAGDTGTAHHFNMMIGANYTADDVAAFNGGAQLGSYDTSAENLITIQLAEMDGKALLQANSKGMNPEDIFTVFGAQGWFDYTPAMEDAIYGSQQEKFSTILNLIDGKTSNIVGNPMISGNNVSGLERVNRERAYIGAMTNRLEHTLTNLQTSSINQQAAESIIRDTDFAQETMKFTKNQILTQTATSMLAQSNMIPSSVIQLIS